MICLTCHAEGRTSKVYEEGSSVTLMTASRFYDENGLYHVHDMNTRTTNYQCSNGHRFQEKKQNEPCWCGFPIRKSE